MQLALLVTLFISLSFVFIFPLGGLPIVTYVVDGSIPYLILLEFKYIRNLYYNLYKSATNYRFASVSSLTHERTRVVMSRFYIGYLF